MKDSNGNVTESTEKVTAENTDGTVKTASESDGTKTMISTTINAADTGTVDLDAIQTTIVQSDAVSDRVSSEDVDKYIRVEMPADSGTVTITPEAISAISQTGAYFVVEYSAGSMHLDSNVVDNLKEPEKDVRIIGNYADDERLTDAQREVRGDKVGFSYYAEVGGERYHQLGGTVTVTIQYTETMGADPGALGVFCIDEEGNDTFMESAFDETANAFVFETDHFSLFIIDEVPVTEDDDNTVVYIAAAIAAVALIAVAAFVIRGKR